MIVGGKVHNCGGLAPPTTPEVIACCGIIQKAPAGTDCIILPSLVTPHIGTNPCGVPLTGTGTPPDPRIGANPEDKDTDELILTSSSGVGCFRFFVAAAVVFVLVVSLISGCGGGEGAVPVVTGVSATEEDEAGRVPVPVAAMIEASAFSRSHLTVSPSDLFPSSLVNWKILAAQIAGIRILLPLPSTFPFWSLADFRFAGGFAICIDGIGCGWDAGDACFGSVSVGSSLKETNGVALGGSAIIREL